MYVLYVLMQRMEACVDKKWIAKADETMSRNDDRNDDDSSLEEEDDSQDENTNNETSSQKISKKRKKIKKNSFRDKQSKVSNKSSFIDDAAVLSGSEDEDGDDSDIDEDDDAPNEYVKDGFVIDDDDDDEDENLRKKRKIGNGEDDDLQDSDDDDDDDDSDDEENSDDDSNIRNDTKKRRRKGRVRKLRDTDVLDEDDLALINEARGISTNTTTHAADDIEYSSKRNEQIFDDTNVSGVPIKARTEAELRKELFIESDDDDADDTNDRRKKQSNMKSSSRGESMPGKKSIRSSVDDDFDEDGMDDFIDYGDDEHQGRRGGRLSSSGDMGRSFRDDEDEGITEEQLQEANDIFGTDFLDFMGVAEDDEYDSDGKKNKRRKDTFRERGVGIDLRGGSDEDEDDYDDEIEDDESIDDEDLFGTNDDEIMDGKTEQQRAEALKLRREKRAIAKEERRRSALMQKSERRKAQLRKAFEPVQLIENFCTERDDEIRMIDAPERLFEWNTPFHGPQDVLSATTTSVTDTAISDEEQKEAVWITGRIPSINSEFLQYTDTSNTMMMKLENDTSSTPQSPFTPEQQLVIDSIVYSLRYIHKEKLEPEFIRRYRADIVTSQTVRDNLYNIMDADSEWDRMINSRNKVLEILTLITDAANLEESLCADEESLMQLKEDLVHANAALEESKQEEEKILLELGVLDKNIMEQEEEDDEDLFGGDGGAGDEEEDEKTKERKKNARERLQSHLKTVQSLIQLREQQVGNLSTSIYNADSNNNSSVNVLSKKAAKESTSKICRASTWNTIGYKEYISTLTDYRQIMDVYSYLSLLKEGNDAIRNRFASNTSLATDENTSDAKRRSRRFDRDYYRTCVSEGLRAICYRFVLAPYRVGMKLGDNFSWDQSLPDENNILDSDPSKWSSPVIEGSDPMDFASELVGSGDLVLLSMKKDDMNIEEDVPEVKDPLRGCRYVAAMELAHEPRVRKHLRNIFRSRAVLTTRPTSKGMETIDYVHEFYGLQLIRNKPIMDHLTKSNQEIEIQKTGLSFEERKELDEKLKQAERESCIQYINILKAEKSGHIKVHIHLPYVDEESYLASKEIVPWYKQGDDFFNNSEKQDLSPLIEELRRVYLPENGDSDEWNKEREKIIMLALTSFIIPQFVVELRRELFETSMKVGIDAAGKSLQSMTMEGAYRPSHLLGENRFIFPTGDLPIVGVCCSSDGKDATFLAAVNEYGELMDHIAIPSGTHIDGGEMREKVITFLMQSRPAAIVVGTHGGLTSRLVTRKLAEIATQATERWNNRFIQGQDEDEDDFESRMEDFRRMYPNHDDEDDSTPWKCNVDMVDDNVAQLFGRSVRGKKEFPDLAINLKCAIAIARHAKDPLAELTYTWCVASDAGIFGTEMLFLNIHPLQQSLPKSLLLREYERVLCNAVADVGVDVNMGCKYIHLNGLLTFVPGLGPRKANSLKQTLNRSGGVLSSRRELLLKRLLGPVVYNNAVAFLRVRAIDDLSNSNLHPLDDTRLHPDVYYRNDWAGKIAIDALEITDNNDRNGTTSDKNIRTKAIRDVMKNSRNEVERLYKATKSEWEKTYGPTFNVSLWDPRTNVPAESWRDKVEELDLDTFAEMIEQNGMGKWLSHLSMIKWEFRLPFGDPRKPMEPLDKEKLFRLLTGESDQTLCPGREVTGKVVRNSDFGSHVKLEGDVPGFIPLRNLADGHVESAEDVIQVGSIVTAIVTEVKKDHMSVDLSLKIEDFKKLPSTWDRPASLPPIDKYFDRDAAVAIETVRMEAREKQLATNKAIIGAKMEVDATAPSNDRTGRVTRRACAHPAFRNARNDEVDKELKDGGEAMVGEALIRPSSKVADSLAMHWLVRPGVIKIIEVIEEDKDNDASIGNRLKVRNEVYGSIDEMIGRYISPMNDRIEEVTHHRKFLDMVEADVDVKLREMKKANPSGVFYYLCWADNHPGYLSLRYVINSTRHHPIGISPEGYVWYRKTFGDIDSLLNDFKKNPRGPLANADSSTSASASANSSMARPRKPNENKPSRWGARPASSQVAPPLQPHPASGGGGWGQRPLPPSMPPPPINVGGWSQAHPPRPPPPSGLPPPPDHNYPPLPPSGPPGYLQH